jgi:NADP-dependent 3-hydroxy acid dehydrogenase YdfG
MTKALNGTAALVTGASSGIGAATARVLAARGAAVSLVARRRDRLDELAALIAADGGTALVIVADISDQRQAYEAVERTVREWGRLDVLVNNAGIARPAPALQAQVSDWEDMVQLNLVAALYCTHAALPHLVQAADSAPRRVADLINVSSLSGRIFRPGSSVYCATKHAMNAHSESLRQELAEHRVRVTILEPAAVETELFPAEVREHRRSERAYPPLSPGDVADAIAYSVTRPAHAAVSNLLIRPTGQQR